MYLKHVSKTSGTGLTEVTLSRHIVKAATKWWSKKKFQYATMIMHVQKNCNLCMFCFHSFCNFFVFGMFFFFFFFH